MRFFKTLLDFYIESSLHVALAVYALIRVTFIKLNIPYDASVACFGFYGTIVGYNFIKYDELARVKKIKSTPTFKAIIGLSALSFIASVVYFLTFNSTTKLLGFGILFIILGYTLPFFPNSKNLRNWSGIKIYLVAIAWVGVTVLVPVFNAEMHCTPVVLLNCMQRFVLVFVLMLLFEIIDLQFDSLDLATMPQKLGIVRTKNLNYFLISLFVVFDFLKPNYTAVSLLISFFIASVLVLFTFCASTNRSKYYTSFWVESIPILWLILDLIFMK